MRKFRLFLAAFVLVFTLIPALGAHAETYNFSIPYTNPETGYVVAIEDAAGLLTSAELNDLAAKMQEATNYGNIVFYTCNRSSSNYNIGGEIDDYFNFESTTSFIINMGIREIYIDSCGSNYDAISTSKANTITDNVYTYASDGDYFGCATNAFEQITAVLSGNRIAQPMKYISNALLAIVVALFIGIIVLKVSTANNEPTTDELFQNLAAGYLDVNGLNSTLTRTKRTYSPPSESSSGGGGGGGGGGVGGHGGGGHSF